mmetsp:Transcript_13149/g.41450  ORF Transcript_13149/g.41450 Transcript_13149/m.41450 type:complete len:109 (-) Transcript_13149:96-422(-)
MSNEPATLADLLPTAPPPLLRAILGATFLSGCLSLYLSLGRDSPSFAPPPPGTVSGAISNFLGDFARGSWQPAVFLALVLGLWLSVEFVFAELAATAEREQKDNKKDK